MKSFACDLNANIASETAWIYIYDASNQLIGFPGQYYDAETGLHYNYFRYYNPQTGRYITPDPIGLEGGINLFSYVDSVGKPFETNLYTYTNNNPINFIDPSGLWSVTIEGYELFGGGIVFGSNPNGGRFISFRAGVGIGGGVSFDPKGTSPGWDPCKKHGLLNVGLGGYAGGNVGFGPFYGGYNAAGGYNIENPGKNYWYFNHGLNYGLDWGFRLRAGVAGGGELTFY